MMIVNKNRDMMINLHMTEAVYIGEDRRTIKFIANTGGKMYRLGEYRTPEEARIAFAELAKNATQEATYVMLDDEGAAKLLRMSTIERPEQHAGNGKKPVRRGGS